MNNEARDKMLIEIHTVVHANAEKVATHDRTLYGNGQPGICTRLKELEMTARLNSKWFVGIISVGSAILGGGVTVVCSLLIPKLIN